MLEQPEYLKVLTMQESESAVNQQGTEFFDNVFQIALDRAWLAGFVDGEGSIGVYDRGGKNKGRGYQPRVTLTNTSMVVLEKITSMLDQVDLAYYVHWSHENKRWRPRWQIIFMGFSRVQAFLSFVSPFLVEKKYQADLVLEYIASRTSKNGFGQNNPFSERELEIVEELKEAKRTRPLRDYMRGAHNA